MEYTTCKDSIMELIDDGSKVFGNDYKISKEMLSKIDEVCDGVDELCLKLNAKVSMQISRRKRRHFVLSSFVTSLSFTEEELTGSSTSLQN